MSRTCLEWRQNKLRRISIKSLKRAAASMVKIAGFLLRTISKGRCFWPFMTDTSTGLTEANKPSSGRTKRMGERKS